jgi:hypothetical protein
MAGKVRNRSIRKQGTKPASFLTGVLTVLWLLATLLCLLSIPIAVGEPLVYFLARSVDLVLNNWIIEWYAWGTGESVRKVPQEFFLGLWKLIKFSWFYIIAYVTVTIVAGIFVRPEEYASTQGSAPARERISPPADSAPARDVILPPADPPKRKERRTEPIPKRVKMYVWQRDEGTCVECGSKEKLEYDHIIPLSKGGSNTDRNLQILCERCNRSKGASIS